MQRTQSLTGPPLRSGGPPLSVPSESAPRLLHGVPVTFDPVGEDLLVQIESGARAKWEDFRLHEAAERLSLCPGFDQLLSLPLTRDVVPYPHQMATVKSVLQRLRGRALLCDEVGLGKTIEAGLILLELSLRGLARKILVLTPPSLVGQWRDELSRKFALPFVTPSDAAFQERGAAAWAGFDRVVASLATAKRAEHAKNIQAIDYDLVILDEAHHLRNRDTLAWRLANGLKRKYVLLLTATPVHNQLEELFNLITLVAPGQLHTVRSFRKEHLSRGEKLNPRDPARLKALVGEVMVRNRRATCGVPFTRRFARTFQVKLEEEEQGLYEEASGLVRSHFASGKPFHRMALQTLQMELGSSPVAAAGTLEKMAGTRGLETVLRQTLLGLARKARAIPRSAKEGALLGLLEGMEEKAIVFTAFRATLESIIETLRSCGISCTAFHGGMSLKEKTASLDRFQGDARVLVSSETGSEGRNLQFCNTVVNYDLPWNPQKIEQRIGRVSRIGQARDVQVLNLAAPQTLEGHLLELLDAKIHMFELVIGEMDMILGNLSDEREFEEILMAMWAEAGNPEAFRTRLDELGENLLEAKRGYLKARQVDDALFGEVGGEKTKEAGAWP